MRWLVRVAMVLAAFAMPWASRADDDRADESERQRVVGLLSDYETLPSPRDLTVGGERTARVLFELYQDVHVATFIRVRALRTLSLFPADVAAARLTSVTRELNARPLFLREGAIALARCAGEAAVDALATLLTRPDKQARRAAVEALRIVATANARARLLTHRATETDPGVRDVLDAALATTAAR
jgi:HEAT repeat protein